MVIFSAKAFEPDNVKPGGTFIIAWILWILECVGVGLSVYTAHLVSMFDRQNTIKYGVKL